MNRSTVQESFWESDFGNKYIERNKDDLLLASNFGTHSIRKNSFRIWRKHRYEY